jgi:tRNA-dihydrouridine synthase A
MLGRSIYHNPWLLAEVDRCLFGDRQSERYREDVIEKLIPYVERELAEGTRLNQISRHLLGLYQQVPGARRYRRLLSEQAHRPGASAETLRAAVAEVTRRAA